MLFNQIEGDEKRFGCSEDKETGGPGSDKLLFISKASSFSIEVVFFYLVKVEGVALIYGP